MALDWKSDLREEAADAIGRAAALMSADEAADVERCANLPAGQDRVLSVETTETMPVTVTTAKHFRNPRLLVWDWRVLEDARKAAREGYPVRLTLVEPKSGAGYINAIERV